MYGESVQNVYTVADERSKRPFICTESILKYTVNKRVSVNKHSNVFSSRF